MHISSPNNPLLSSQCEHTYHIASGILVLSVIFIQVLALGGEVDRRELQCGGGCRQSTHLTLTPANLDLDWRMLSMSTCLMMRSTTSRTR